ncbi:ATP-binding protein [Patiriisocius sp. Uisw_047]|jgi:signal transduction histidine kinase|uniref:PAS domain-containing sensor histidine kinase n=1 Tax=Patiriisocius sp. Uisw_047 TaxID=3230969 RepID=UPI0039E9976A
MNILTQNRRSVVLKEKSFQSFDTSYYKEVAALIGAGGWSIDFENKRSNLDPTARAILRVPKNYRPSLNKLIEFYVEGEHKKYAAKTFLECADGVSFNIDIKMLAYDKKPFWVKATGRPRYREDGKISGIYGVFVDIDKQKKKELALEASLKTIEEQKNRLQNFTYIVSHNLKSHTNNIQLSLELMGMNDDSTSETDESMNRLSNIPDNLNKTITDLNEIISVKNTNLDYRKIIKFQDVYDRVSTTLENEIKGAKADLFVDFTEFPEVEHIEPYLESILQNLLVNALRNKHPNRNSTIQICTYYDDDDNGCLLIKDNGLGIDLEAFGDQIFSMHQTFHNNANTTGMGLYMTRNQVESLGGIIEVESVLDKNTTFNIRF